MTTSFHAKYWAHALTVRGATGSIEALSRSIAGSRVDLNPHQVDAALFAIRSPPTKGVILADEVGEGRSLLITCAAFRAKNLDAFPNLTIKKIPKAVLSRCEWGKDDYSLEIESLPIRSAESNEVATHEKPRTKEERRATVQQESLFDQSAAKLGEK